MGAPALESLRISFPIARRSAWLAGLVACVCVSLSSFAAAGDSGALQLRGIVPLACSIQVDPTQAASSLDLSSSSTDVVVASVTETCNSSTGYTIEVSSSGNGSFLGELDAITYMLKYDETQADLSSSGVLVSSAAGRTGLAGVTRAVTVSYAAATNQSGGTYEDTLVFTVAAK